MEARRLCKFTALSLNTPPLHPQTNTLGHEILTEAKRTVLQRELVHRPALLRQRHLLSEADWVGQRCFTYLAYLGTYSRPK